MRFIFYNLYFLTFIFIHFKKNRSRCVSILKQRQFWNPWNVPNNAKVSFFHILYRFLLTWDFRLATEELIKYVNFLAIFHNKKTKKKLEKSLLRVVRSFKDSETIFAFSVDIDFYSRIFWKIKYFMSSIFMFLWMGKATISKCEFAILRHLINAPIFYISFLILLLFLNPLPYFIITILQQ